MFRYINAIVIDKHTLFDNTQTIKVFSWEEGRLSILFKPEKRSTPITAPGLYSLEILPKSTGVATCRSAELLEGFFQTHHLKLHGLCLPVFDYFPPQEPSPFVFGRYLSALRRSTNEESARTNALWFLASVLWKEGFLEPNSTLEDFIRRRHSDNLKVIWKTIKRRLKALEGKS